MNKATTNANPDTSACSCPKCKPEPRLVLVKIADTNQPNIDAVPDVLRANLALMGVRAEVIVPDKVIMSDVPDQDALNTEELARANDAFEVVSDLAYGVLGRLIALDADLSPEEVRMRYDAHGEGFEHPYGGREDWRAEVGAGVTDLGYWEWIVQDLQNHRAERARKEAVSQEAEIEASSVPGDVIGEILEHFMKFANKGKEEAEAEGK
jgi:hypothetical protein